MLNPIVSSIAMVCLFFLGGFIGSRISEILVKRSPTSKLMQLSSILL